MGGESLELVADAQLEVTPLTRDFAQVVALLPSLEPMGGGIFHVLALAFTRNRGRGAKPGPKRIQDRGDVIVELRSRKRRPRCHRGISPDRFAPCRHDRLVPAGQVLRQRE